MMQVRKSQITCDQCYFHLILTTTLSHDTDKTDSNIISQNLLMVLLYVSSNI